MKRFIYILLAGLTAAGLASCDKQELKPSLSDVYSVVIEDGLHTKVSAIVSVGEEHTFYATLKKNGTPVSCSNFSWNCPDIFTKQAAGSKQNSSGVTIGYLTVKGAKVGSGIVNAWTDKSNTGGMDVTSNDVDCSTTPVLSSIALSITGNNPIVVGNQSSYKVTATYNDGSTKDITSEATVSSTNTVGLNCSGGIISTSKINGCLGKRSLTASYDGKTSSSVDITVTTDFDYLKFNFNSESDVFSDIRDYAINSKNAQSGLQLHSETGASSGDITFSIRSFSLYIKGSYNPYYGNVTYKMDNTEFRDTVKISATRGNSYTLHIYYLGEEVFSQKVTIVTS